ncbi:hypothetical protein [Bacteroides sp. UBA939]|uniref:hypothetical protein n=1 Tax=Bacteroides sp. UBA939 TaxID=1946092 RepID=UPI0025C32024|nr:hypothetical protein [Bacteroides sp. UBA939]
MKSLKANNKKRIIFFLMLIPAFILGSCIYEEDMEGGQNSEDKKLSLSVAVKQPGIQTVTRATVPSEVGEDDISVLYLLFFQPNGGTFVDYVRANNLTQDVKTEIDMSNHPLLAVNQAYDILAVANISDGRYITGNVDAWMHDWGGLTIDEVKAQAIAWVYDAQDNSNAIVSNELLMTGSIAKAQEQFELELELTRDVVRFDVYNNRYEVYDLVSADIWNAYPSCVIWESEGAMIDFSNDISRLDHFYGVDNSTNETATDGADGRGKTLGHIIGGLYSFENRVIHPLQNDHLTTCLIVGLKERATGTISYYRVNINPAESAQILSANNVYRLTIRDVNTGSASAEEAYEAAECGLDYVINYWDMSDYGVIVQDGNSVLSIPTKTITIEEKGGDLNYQIFTFNNTGTNSPLTIKAQNYTPSNGSIAATLSGNTLRVHATPFGAGETERTGTIVLSYAGLEAAVNVIQNNGEKVYLDVRQPTGKVLAPYSGMSTGDILVDASGPWTAELFMPDGGFTLDPAGVSPAVATTKIQSNSSLVVNKQFKVYTWSANAEPTKRDCFVVITLDSDPEDYAAVVQLAQSPAGGISIVPNVTSVTFNGIGGLANIAGNTTSTFNVRPSMEVDGNNGEQIAAWEYEIRSSGGSYDDTGTFRVTAENHTTDANEAAMNTITVGAVGQNLSGRSYTAVLRLYLSLDHTTYVDLQLVQQPLTVSLSPGTLPTVGNDGGQTGVITVVSDASLRWKASVVTNSGTSSDGRSLVHHAATLVNEDGSPIDENLDYPMNTRMRVRFPKVYYPNRDIPVSATITVTVEGLTSTLTVHQTTLTARSMVGYGMTGSPDYGGLGNTYNQGWDGTSGTYGLAQIPDYSRLGIGNMNVASIPDNVNYLHATVHIGGTAGTNYDWSVINSFIDSRDAWTVISSQDDYGLPPVNNSNSPTKRNEAGYQDMKYSVSSRWSQVYETDSKLYHFVMDRGHTPLAPSDINSDGFYNDGVSNTIPGPWPSTAVVLMTKINDTNEASLIVDVKNKFLWIGDSQIFWYNAYLSNNRGTFLDNLMYFIGNAAKYGSNFTDLLLEDDQEGAQPAPWDTYWGNNAGVPSK